MFTRGSSSTDRVITRWRLRGNPKEKWRFRIGLGDSFTGKTTFLMVKTHGFPVKHFPTKPNH
jgi:hypothetical protein